jgi:hypothetical protein
LRTLFVETDLRWTNPDTFVDINVAPLLTWDYREGTPYNVPQSTNAENMAWLARMPKGLRGVRANWFGDSRLDPAHSRQQSIEWAKTIHKVCGSVDLVFVDNEEWPKNYQFLNELMEPLTKLSRASCNWNDCETGKGWWGKYDGRIIGTHSCPQAYEMLDNASVRRWMDVVRRCAPAVVVHLPICQRYVGGQWIPEYNTNRVFSRTRQLIFYAASQGVRNFVMADYMLPSIDQRQQYIDFCSRCLLDADRVYPLEN